MSTVDVVYDSEGNNIFGDLCVSGGRLNAMKALQNSYHIHDDILECIDEWHTINCETCEESHIEQPHELIPYEYDSRYEHVGICACGYRQYAYHSEFYDDSPTSDFIHYGRCACGSEQSYYHVYVEVEDSIVPKWICRYCERITNILLNPVNAVSQEMVLSMSEPTIYILEDGTSIRFLTESGSYVMSNGVIVLSPEDAALVEAGLLDPYELVENVTVPTNPDHVTE